MDVGVVPKLVSDDRANSRAYRSLYDWIRKNLPSDSNILWQDDTALYLATGHHTVSFVVPGGTLKPREARSGGETLRFRGIDEYARQQHLGYILLAKVGLRHNDEVLRVAAADVNLEAIHEEAGGILYRVR